MYPTLVQADDLELKKRILISLQSHGVNRLTETEIEVAGGVVLLRGRFDSSRDRNRALECCRHVAGVLRIEDWTMADHEYERLPDGEVTSHTGGYAAFSVS